MGHHGNNTECRNSLHFREQPIVRTALSSPEYLQRRSRICCHRADFGRNLWSVEPSGTIGSSRAYQEEVWGCGVAGIVVVAS